MGTPVRVPNLLVQGVDVGGCSHPHLYHLGRSWSLRRCSSLCVAHDPKGKKVGFDVVVSVASCYSH